MGARLPPVQRPRRGGVKCEFCGRAVPSLAALRSHQNTLHATALKRKELSLKKKLKTSKGQKPEPRKVVAKKIAPKLIPKANNKPETKAVSTTEKVPDRAKTVKPKSENGVEKPKMETDSTLKKSMTNKTRTTEFQCPKCKKLFAVMFSAQKHIQKHHREDSSSKDLKPIQLDFCTFCDDKLPTSHDCPNGQASTLYECVGCDHEFISNKLFDLHVADIHGDMCDSLFFPTKEEFSTWKELMEIQTDCKYTVIGTYNSKQVHRCSGVTNDGSDDVLRFCPSTIISMDVSNGVQVYLYLEHHGHKHKEYKLSEEYKSYSVADLIQQAGCTMTDVSSVDGDLYLQFKVLMESIVLDAAKLKITTLKVLIAKALDMNLILKQYDEDEETTFADTSMLSLSVVKKEDNITKALDGLRSSKRIRKNTEENGTAEKRAKVNTKTQARNKFSLADEKDSDKILKELDRENIKKGPKVKVDEDEIENVNNGSPQLRSMLNQSPRLSFNDSYKDFIMKNVPNTKPGAKPDVKNVPSTKPGAKPDVKNVPSTKPGAKPELKKKNVVKTKIGQFKPSLSPKKDETKRRISKAEDFEYEVKEQENDCNILILKI